MLTPQTVPVLDVGYRLANGATVLCASEIVPPGNGFVAHGIVLAVTADGMFATWIYRMPTQTTHSGEYFPTLPEALRGFQKRCEGARLAVIAGA
jgi:hypothetical protein